MLEAELFALFEQTADAAYSVTSDGEICSWNTAAERLFGYPAAEVLGRHIEDVFDAYDALGTEPLAGGGEVASRHWSDVAGGMPAFDLDVRVRSGEDSGSTCRRSCSTTDARGDSYSFGWHVTSHSAVGRKSCSLKR